jgi:two-component system nitrogen regulation response regulator GlnG/two-component system response regulator HydG
VTEDAPRILGLAIVWSHDEPHRAGEVGLVPPDRTLVLGRGDPGDGAGALAFVRQRPGVAEATPPLASPRISRQQLRVHAVDEGQERALAIRNVGRCRLVVDGEETAEIEVRPGDVLELGSELVLLCVERPAVLAPLSSPYPPFVFGRADAHGLVGESPEAWRLREVLAFVARRPGHVLVRGASGTGKELVARALHALSPRASRPIVARNAATFPEGLIDAELFGNAKSYPNAGMEARAGLIGEADGSTLLLDELAELPHAMQAHVLRVLDAGEYTRLGEARPRTSDFRLVAATNRDESALKHDVLARLTFRIVVPDLNARREDVPLLAAHLLRRIARKDPEAVARFFGGSSDASEPRTAASMMRALVTRPWSTHVRELETLIWEAVLATRGDRLALPPPTTAPEASAPAASPSIVPAPADGAALTPVAIQACLDANNGVIERAWRPLGLPSRHALARLIKKHGLELRRSRGK